MSKKLAKIADRIADVFFIEDWKWVTYRGEVQPSPFNPSVEQVADYIERLSIWAIDEAGSDPDGRIFLHGVGDGKVEVYLRMGTYKP